MSVPSVQYPAQLTCKVQESDMLFTAHNFKFLCFAILELLVISIKLTPILLHSQLAKDSYTERLSSHYPLYCI
jgi:hypothetical protein